MKWGIPVVAVLLLLFPGLALATSISVGPAYWTGYRSTVDSSLITADGWSGSGNNGFQISWEISYTGTLYHYEYVISGVGGNPLSRELSHWILEVSYPSDALDFSDVIPLFSGEPTTFEPSGEKGDQPDMPGNIYGIKWEDVSPPEEGEPWTFSFDTIKNPVWGDFYAKDGKDDGIFATSWNIGFGTDPDSSVTDFTSWIPTPNSGAPPPTPEPATILMLGSGMIGLAAIGRKKFLKK